jgi:pimeloyl-ACP methyl ester carboxylesterase
MAFCDVPGARLFYADTGGPGVPVVFVHPAAATSDCWVHQLEPFAAAGYRCITYDLRGWGKSHIVDPDADVGIMSDDLQALVSALNLEQFDLLGAAYGAFAALDYALRYQERVRALVLATTMAGLSDPEFTTVRDRALAPEIRDLPLHLRELGPSYRAENPAGVARWLDILHHSGESRAKRQRLAQRLTLPLLETISTPTLVLAADADLLAPPAVMRLVAERIRDSVWATIADAGHSAHWERPHEWNRIVLDFLRTSVP